jgi:hypothetical protein
MIISGEYVRIWKEGILTCLKVTIPPFIWVYRECKSRMIFATPVCMVVLLRCLNQKTPRTEIDLYQGIFQSVKYNNRYLYILTILIFYVDLNAMENNTGIQVQLLVVTPHSVVVGYHHTTWCHNLEELGSSLP